MFLFVGVVAVLPFGVIPVPIAGAQLTLVDALLIATYPGVLARVAFRRLAPAAGHQGAALLGFVLIVVAAFIGGAAATVGAARADPPCRQAHRQPVVLRGRPRAC